ncbi:hypothetical protein ACFX14_003755 [Malus domestica]
MDLYTFPVEGLLQSVTSLAASEIGLFPGFKKELTELRQSSLEIQQYLGDVAHQPRDRNMAVRIWVKNLKDVAHDADDVLEDINYEVLRRTVEIQNHMKKKEEMLVKSRNREQEQSDFSLDFSGIVLRIACFSHFAFSRNSCCSWIVLGAAA